MSRRRHAVHSIVLLLALAGAALSLGTAQATDCTWNISGSVRLQHSLGPATALVPLKNVEVRIRGARVGAIYATWGERRTDDEGRFAMSTTRSCHDRNFAVDVRYDDARLEIKGGWRRVYTTSHRVGPGDVALHRVLLDPDHNADHDYNRALAWFMVHELDDVLHSIDPSRLDFRRKFKLDYPAALALRPYAWNDVVHIPAAHFRPVILMHETMHIWAYQHSAGSTLLDEALLADFNTHDPQEHPDVAFHEGFAEFAANAVLEAIWGWDHGVNPPPAPAHLEEICTGIVCTSLTMVSQNGHAVTRAFFLLTTPDLFPRRVIGCPAEPRVDVFDVLSTFGAAPAAGYLTDWITGPQTPGLIGFFDRAADLIPSLSEPTKDLMLALLDPASAVAATSACQPPPPIGEGPAAPSGR